MRKRRLNWRGYFLLGLIAGILISTVFTTNDNSDVMVKEEVVSIPQQSDQSQPDNIIPVCAEGVNKTYMSYEAITDRSSKQYQYIKEHMTPNDKGYLVDSDGYIGVALGSYFGPIGSKYAFTLSSGEVLNVVKVEEKDDAHTNNGCEQKWDKSVIEFVIDTTVAAEYYGVASNGYINQGNYNSIYKGYIVKIERR